jgi:mannose-6-phosphate isomerase-like protein (cupin superfamily)
MKHRALKALLVASVLVPVAARAQGAAPTTATVITKEDIDKVSQTEQSLRTKDENVAVVDIGNENFALGVIHRASTRTPPPAREGGAAAAAADRKVCGREMASLPPGGIPGGITHDSQTEGYYIISGGGTLFIDGYIVNGRHGEQPEPGGPNGPSCGGMAYGARKVEVKVGDVVIVPPNVVHGWADIPDHVDYLSFRPSQHVMQAGWVNPTVAKK